ncbi:MAG TPA: hypothetical protein VFE67_12050 [Rudaea sp.]|nr:hypothetical protein [Rudaea sp.]
MDDKKICGFFTGLDAATRARARHFCARLVLMALLAVSSTGGAQELILNGDFDSDLSGWTVSDAPGTTWVAFDYAGALSGSAQFANDMTTAGGATINLTQCVVLAKAGRYVISANGFLPAGQASGNLYVNPILHIPTTTCQGLGGGIGFLLPATIGSWSQEIRSIEIDDIDALAGASLEVRMGIQKTPADGSIQGFMDAVRVIYDPVFAGGFEPPAGAGN